LSASAAQRAPGANRRVRDAPAGCSPRVRGPGFPGGAADPRRRPRSVFRYAEDAGALPARWWPRLRPTRGPISGLRLPSWPDGCAVADFRRAREADGARADLGRTVTSFLIPP